MYRVGGGNAHLRRPEDLVLNPELAGNRAGDLLRRGAAVHHVEDSAAVVDQRLEDLLQRGVIPRHVPPADADDREHFTGRRDRPANELSLRLLKCAEQLRGERQRSAGAGGESQEITAVDRSRFPLRACAD